MLPQLDHLFPSSSDFTSMYGIPRYGDPYRPVRRPATTHDPILQYFPISPPQLHDRSSVWSG